MSRAAASVTPVTGHPLSDQESQRINAWWRACNYLSVGMIYLRDNPLLNLNGYKIANPTILARIGHEEPEALLRGSGYMPYFVEGDDPEGMHQLMASTLDTVVAEIRAIQQTAGASGQPERHAHLPPAGCQHPAGGGGAVPALDRLHQCHHGRQAETPAVHHHRRGHRVLRQGHRHLGQGQQ